MSAFETSETELIERICPNCGDDFFSVIWDVCEFCRNKDKSEAYFSALDPRTNEEDEAETQDKFLAEMYDEIAEARLCTRFGTQL
jgi:hypothetical protein